MASFPVHLCATALACLIWPFSIPATALAQGAGGEATGAPLDLFSPGKGDFALPALRQTLSSPLPLTPGVQYRSEAANAGAQTNLHLEARLSEDAPPMTNGVEWRIFDATPSETGTHPLLVSAVGGTATIPLPAGQYLIHAAFGRAGVTKRIDLGAVPQSENLNLEAGGLRLNSIVGDDRIPDPDKVRFEISIEGEEGEREIIARDVRPDRIVGLKAGVYHVVSRYGEVNATVRADIEVPAGKLTDVTMRHTGAEVTLKLVEHPGGEALANTSWTVLTSGGDTIHESVGAFPRIILAEGSYTAVARHKNATFARDFKTSPGINHDVEVRLGDRLNDQPETTSR